MRDFAYIYHTDPSIESIQKLFEREQIFGLSINDFLNYPPKDTSRNRDLIFKSLTVQKQKEIGSADNVQENIELPAPLKLRIPKENLSIDLILTESNFKAPNFDYNAFVVESLKDVLNNNGFYDSSEIMVKSEPSATVWLWSKALATKSGGIGKLIDISPWVEQLDTNVTKTGGNFSLTLAPIKASLKGAWAAQAENGELDSFFEKHDRQNPNNNYESGVPSGFWETKNGERVAKISITEGNVIDGRTQYFFHHVISNNDLLFISFDNKEPNFTGDNITNADLPYQFFEMIGLVDDNSTSYDPMGNVMISITGRDCMKLLLEDGTFFFSNSFASKDSEGGVFKNQAVSADGTSTFNKIDSEATTSRSSARMKVSGIVEGFFNPNLRTIDKIMNLLVGHLSNIQICPDELFEFYGDRRTEFQFEIGEENADKIKEEQKIDYIYDE